MLKLKSMPQTSTVRLLDNKQAIRLIKILVPHLENTDVQIVHSGEYDAKGWKHADSLQTIDFLGSDANEPERLVIWKDDAKYYRGSRAQVVSGIFKAYNYLHAINFIP